MGPSPVFCSSHFSSETVFEPISLLGQGLSRTVFANWCVLPILAGKMLPVNLVVAASFLMVAFNAITAMPHIRERHIIRVPLKFKIIHHHKIQKIPIIIKKHVHYYKDKQPVVKDAHSNHIFHEGSDDHFGDDFHFHQEEDGQEFLSSGISYDHHSDHVTHEDDYDEEEQSQEDDYENDEYE